MLSSRGYAAKDAKSKLAPFSFERRDPRDNDVVIEIAFCGICHSDIHSVRKNGETPSIHWFPATRSSES